jgi:hypothetical protein
MVLYSTPTGSLGAPRVLFQYHFDAVKVTEEEHNFGRQRLKSITRLASRFGILQWKHKDVGEPPFPEFSHSSVWGRRWHWKLIRLKPVRNLVDQLGTFVEGIMERLNIGIFLSLEHWDVSTKLIPQSHGDVAPFQVSLEQFLNERARRICKHEAVTGHLVVNVSPTIDLWIRSDLQNRPKSYALVPDVLLNVLVAKCQATDSIEVRGAENRSVVSNDNGILDQLQPHSTAFYRIIICVLYQFVGKAAFVVVANLVCERP